MSGGLLWLSALLCLAIPGAPLLSHAAFRRLPLMSRVILAGGAGAVLVSFAMTVFVLLGARWSLAGLLLASGLLAFLLRWAIRDAPAPPSEIPRSSGLAVAAARVLSATGVMAALIATTAGSASSPDLIFFWGPKAQQFALARTVDARFLAQPLLQYMHPYYPPLVTNLYALASMAAGRMSWTGATLLFPLLLAALALGLPGVLQTRVPATASAAASALVVCAIAYLGMEADIGGNAEMPLLFFETMAVALLLSPLSADAAGQLLAGLLLAGAACAKVEGLPFILSAVLAFLWMHRKGMRPLWPAALRLLGPTAVSLLAWFAFGEVTHLFRGYSGEGKLLDLHFEHFAAVVRGIVSALASTGYGLPYLIPLGVLLAAARRLTRASMIPLVIAAALTVFLLFTYMDRPGDPSQWIAWSAARVFSPLPMLFALAATCVGGVPGGPAKRTPQPTRP